MPDKEPGLSPYLVTGPVTRAGFRSKVLLNGSDSAIDEETKMDPLIEELYQLYRIDVRGWFEALHFTRRTFVVVLIVVLVSDLIWRQVC